MFRIGSYALGKVHSGKGCSVKEFLRRHINMIFILGTLLIILGFGIGNNELSNMWQALTTLSFRWMLSCVAVYGIYVLLDSLTVYYFLRKQQHPVTLKYAVFIAIMGLYYADITPGASGGQPMQVYYLKKRNVPIGISTSALAVKFFCFQFMLLIFGAVAWTLYGAYVTMQLIGIRWILVAGYVFNSISVTLVLLMAVSKRVVRFFLYGFIKIGHKLHLCKDVHQSILKWEGVLSSFHASVDLIRNRPKELLVQLLLAGLQVFALMAMTVCVYFAFGLSGTNIGKQITMALLLNISAAYTPLPGGSGAQEGGFLLYFKNIFPDDRIFTGMLIWRFFTFYLNLIAGACATFLQSTYGFYRDKRRQQALQQSPASPPEQALPKKKAKVARKWKRAQTPDKRISYKMKTPLKKQKAPLS